MEEQNVDGQDLEALKQEELHQEEQNHQDARHEDRFTDFMFGQRRGHPQKNEPKHELNTHQNNIDYEQLFVHFDTLMESTRNLKPLFLKFYPFVERIWKKK
jgi:hypothetical protein